MGQNSKKEVAFKGATFVEEALELVLTVRLIVVDLGVLLDEEEFTKLSLIGLLAP